MTRDKVTPTNFHYGYHRLDSTDFGKQPTFSRNGTNILITTEIFGDITGKSYLLMSDAEFEILTGNIPEGKDPNVNLKEEYTKELDNILSASVITCLSNNLKRKMYGDIPVMIGRTHGKIQDFIVDDFSEVTEEVYVNSAYFTFDGNPAVNPFFIWVVDSSCLEVLAANSVL